MFKQFRRYNMKIVEIGYSQLSVHCKTINISFDKGTIRHCVTSRHYHNNTFVDDNNNNNIYNFIQFEVNRV